MVSHEIMERTELLAILAGMGHVIPLTGNGSAARTRAEYLVQHGAGIADAAHLAFAEASEADFVTCDDRLLRICRKVRATVWYGTPTEFCCKEDLR